MRPALQTYVGRDLLQNEDPSPEVLNRACERLLSALRPYIDIMVKKNFKLMNSQICLITASDEFAGHG